jgi:hypothetical protein
VRPAPLEERQYSRSTNLRGYLSGQKVTLTLTLTLTLALTLTLTLTLTLILTLTLTDGVPVRTEGYPNPYPGPDS